MASADTIVPPAMTADIVQAGEPGVPPVPTAIDPTTSAIASPALSIAPTLAEYPESVNEEVKPAPSSPEKSPTRSPHVGASPSLSRVPTLAEHSGYNGTTTLPASHAKTAASARPEEPGLTDQTNFLPMRQVIYIFCGLSLGLGCTFLDQTMWVPIVLCNEFERLHWPSWRAEWRRRCRASRRICMQARRARGSRRRTYSQGLRGSLK
jgi:hypothetical protein